MPAETVTLDRGTYVILPEQEYQELMARAAGVELPAYPPADKRGRRPAKAFMLASMARQVIGRRIAAGWTQEQLARRARLRVETISRLESAKHTPQASTIAKIERAFAIAGV